MSILSKRANATARHEIDSKLKTMRMRITENSAGWEGGGIASFYIFSKACYLHKDYFKLLEEIFPKPSAHSWQSFPSPSDTEQTLLVILNRCAPRFGLKNETACRCARCITQRSFHRVRNFLPLCQTFFINVVTLNKHLKTFPPCQKLKEMCGYIAKVPQWIKVAPTLPQRFHSVSINVRMSLTEKLKNDLYSACSSCGYCTENYMPKEIRKDENKTWIRFPREPFNKVHNDSAHIPLCSHSVHNLPWHRLIGSEHKVQVKLMWMP